LKKGAGTLKKVQRALASNMQTEAVAMRLKKQAAER